MMNGKPAKKGGGFEGRLEAVQHWGKKLVKLDMSSRDRDEARQLLRDYDGWVMGQKSRSLRLLLNFDGFYYDPAFITQWKRALGRHDAFIKKSAIINAPPLLHVIVALARQFATLSAAPMKRDRAVFFPGEESALDWLAES